MIFSLQLFTSEKHVRISGEIFVNLESSSAPISSSIIQNNFSKLSHVSLVHPSTKMHKMQIDFKSLVCSVHSHLCIQMFFSSCQKGLCSQQGNSWGEVRRLYTLIQSLYDKLYVYAHLAGKFWKGFPESFKDLLEHILNSDSKSWFSTRDAACNGRGLHYTQGF